MTSRRPSARTRRVAVAALVTVLGAVGLPLTLPAAAGAPRVADTVVLHVDDVTPSTPDAPKGRKRTPLSLGLTLTNTSGSRLRNVRILVFRGNPVTTDDGLTATAADGPQTDGYPVAATRAVRVDLGPGQQGQVTFRTTASLVDDQRGLCLCHNAIYPLNVVARARGGSGAVLGATRTYVPSLFSRVQPVRVGWVWPLIDRPHRLTADKTFTDDQLTSTVADGGRLDRALRVVELLDPDIPITLVIDPELLDELEVMTGKYRVRPVRGPERAGTGTSAAAGWLDRLRDVLTTRPAVQLSLTPYADPDVQALASRGQSWENTMPTAMATRVAAALAGRTPSADLAWPAAGVVGQAALDAMATSGVTTVVLDGTNVSPATDRNGLPTADAMLSAAGGRVAAAVVPAGLQRQVAATLTAGSATANLPELVAGIAIRAIQAAARPGGVQPTATLAPPRYVDPDPGLAARVVTDTSTSRFASPVPVRRLAGASTSPNGALRVSSGAASGVPTLPARNVEAARAAAAAQPTLGSMLIGSDDPTTRAGTLLAGIPGAVQRLKSSAWRPTSDGPLDSSAGTVLADRMTTYLRGLLTSVRIVRPQSATGGYTLGSENSSLPITVENTSPYEVAVSVKVRTRDNLTGYSMSRIPAARTLEPNSKQTVGVPSRVDRSGRIPLLAQLSTPSGDALGPPVALYVRSTVLGTVGIVITVVAGSVLALALLVRLVRRMRRIRRQAAATAQRVTTASVSAMGSTVAFVRRVARRPAATGARP